MGYVLPCLGVAIARVMTNGGLIFSISLVAIVSLLTIVGRPAAARAEVQGMSGYFASDATASRSKVMRGRAQRSKTVRRSAARAAVAGEWDDEAQPRRRTTRRTQARRHVSRSRDRGRVVRQARKRVAAYRSGTSGRSRVSAQSSANREEKIAAALSMNRKPSTTPVRVASLGPTSAPTATDSPAPGPSLTGGAISWRANASCLASNLRGVVASLVSFGSVTVTSTCRSVSRNRRVGGARKSWHLTGNAVDVRVRGNVRGAIAYLRSHGGGFKHYGGGLFHVDNGPRRRF